MVSRRTFFTFSSAAATTAHSMCSCRPRSHRRRAMKSMSANRTKKFFPKKYPRVPGELSASRGGTVPIGYREPSLTSKFSNGYTAEKEKRRWSVACRVVAEVSQEPKPSKKQACKARCRSCVGRAIHFCCTAHISARDIRVPSTVRLPCVAGHLCRHETSENQTQQNVSSRSNAWMVLNLKKRQLKVASPE